MNYINDFSLEFEDYKTPYDMYQDVADRDVHEARYRVVNGIKDNPNICALPPLLEGYDLIMDYLHMEICNREFLQRLSVADRISSLMAIKDNCKVFLPFYADLERRFLECLISAYSARKYGYIDSFDEGPTSVYSVSNQIGTGVQDMSLIGTAGTGKSSAVEKMLSRYPRCIRHKINGVMYSQIIYLSAIANGGTDIKVLFYTFAAQIDTIMGTDGYYEKEMIRRGSVAKMANYLVKLIKLFHVGIIIIDEIQLLVKKQIFEHLLSITASSAVSILLIGTEEAIAQLNRKEWFARRFSHLGRIESDILIKNSSIMETIVKQIWESQWTLEEQKLSEATINAMINESGGNIDFLTTIFITAQLMVIKSENSKKPLIIDEKLIKKAASRYPMAKKLILKGVSDIENVYVKEKNDAFAAISGEVKALRKNDEATLVNQATNHFIERSTILSDITERIQLIDDYDEKTIEKTFRQMERKGTRFDQMPRKQSAKLVLTELLKKSAKQDRKNQNRAKKDNKDILGSMKEEFDSLMTEEANALAFL